MCDHHNNNIVTQDDDPTLINLRRVIKLLTPV